MIKFLTNNKNFSLKTLRNENISGAPKSLGFSSVSGRKFS